MKYSEMKLAEVVFHHILEESDIDPHRITIAHESCNRFNCRATFTDYYYPAVIKAHIQIQSDFSFTDVAYIYVDVYECPGDTCMKHYTYENGDVVDQLTGEVIFH